MCVTVPGAHGQASEEGHSYRQIVTNTQKPEVGMGRWERGSGWGTGDVPQRVLAEHACDMA